MPSLGKLVAEAILGTNRLLKKGVIMLRSW